MRRRKFVIVGLVICLALGFLGYVGYTLLGNSLEHYSTVSKLKEMGDSIYDEKVQVEGDIVPGSIDSDTENNILTFTITDGQETLDVSYEGTRPDSFGDETQVFLEGKLSSTGIFHASKINTKCPSKYEAEEQ